jgi:hypothetical protein
VALVRNEEQASKLKAAYPNVEAVLGNLDSEDVLIREASKANIVISSTFPIPILKATRLAYGKSHLQMPLHQTTYLGLKR